MRKALCALAVFGVGLPLAGADFDWAVISTAGSPDPVTAFDLANPAGLQSPLGQAQGNFNRGMEFYSPDEFYYTVTTDSLNDPGDAGLWVWKNNVSTQVFANPFQDSGDGDIALTADQSTLFWVAADPDSGGAVDALYRYDNLGGAITLTKVGATGLSTIRGLAISPIDGKMYALDAGTDSLYTLDPTTGQETLIGALGYNAFTLGAMDFDASGSTLLHASGGDLYKLDVVTGAGTFVGDLGLNVSALSYRIPEPASLVLLVLAGACLRRR